MTKILFVCHGNICRSAAAEYVLKHLLENEDGLRGRVGVESAATSSEELGNPVYPPMARVLGAHGVRCDGHGARKLVRGDYEAHDLIIYMDSENLFYMKRILGNDPDGKFVPLMAFAGAGKACGDVAVRGSISKEEPALSKEADASAGGKAGFGSGSAYFEKLLGNERISPELEVADPWYTRDFEGAYRQIEAGCKGLVKMLARGEIRSV